MVFSSIPAYLDPANWQQQPNHHHTHHIPPPPPPPPPPHGSGGAGSIRPGSMADRARLANIPMPETALKCPRCESTNTKFCYFNNYSLTQPRHFCKTCRRYWTRGGALRNLPVGGGCRRTKRSSKKSPVSSSTDRPAGSGSSSTVSSYSGASDILGLSGPQISPLRFMAPLHRLSEFGSGDHIGLHYGSLAGGANDLNFQLGNALATASLYGGGGGAGSVLSMSGLEQWRFQQGQQQQFPLFGGLDISAASAGLYPFEGGADQQTNYGGGSCGGAGVGQGREKISNSLSTQMASVKMEDHNNTAGINLSDHHHYWTGSNANNWTDLSNFSSSSSTNPL